MATLADCIAKAGKALSGQDRAAIEALAAEGLADAQAVERYLSEMDGELDSMADLVEEAGGAVTRQIEGLPSPIDVPGRGQTDFGTYAKAVEVAARYAEEAGIDRQPVTRYAPLDRARAERIAAEFELMEHNPSDPQVKAAYDAMIDETIAQFRAILKHHPELKIEFIKGEDPYANSPREAVLDVLENDHLWVFSTRDGFGSDETFDPVDNPLLRETEFEIDGVQLLANDVFRIVHDYFGHIMHGNGFRAGGEEHAWQEHASMYSPLARRAMTVETRGQNSWLNFGPHGEHNRTAKSDDTIFADQKIGLLPLWVSSEGQINEQERRAGDPRFTRGLEGAIREDGRLELVHYSKQPIERTDPGKFGTGLDITAHRRWKEPGTFFGIVGATENGYRKERGLGREENVTSVDPTLLYPANANPDGLWVAGDMKLTNENLREAGYIGWWANDPRMGKAAFVFDPLPVEERRLSQGPVDPQADDLPDNFKAYREEQEARPIIGVVNEPIRNKGGKYRRNANGDITGAPPGVSTQRQVNAIIKRMVEVMDDPLAQMPDSADWYEVSGKAIREISANDPVRAEQLVRMMAVLSASNQVGGNTTGAIKAIHQLARGETPAAGRFPKVFAKHSEAILAAEDMSQEVPGVEDKIMSFYRNLWDATFLSDRYENAATMDMWMARLYGYSGDTFGNAQYRFANMITQEVAAAYNKKYGVDLKPRQVQAALWVYARNRERFGSDPTVELKLEDRQAFDTYIERAKQTIPLETIPSVTSGLAPELHVADLQRQREYTDQSIQLILNETGGNELFDRIGIPLHQLRVGEGSFKGEITPNAVFSIVSEKTGGKYDTEKADLAARALQYIYTQDAVLWAQFDPTLKGATPGVAVRLSEEPTAEMEAAFIAHVGDQVDGADFMRVGNDMIMLNYTGLSNRKFLAQVKGAAESYEGVGSETITEIKSDVKAASNYLEQDWSDEDQAISSLESIISEGGRSDLLPWLRERREAVARLQADFTAQRLEQDSDRGFIQLTAAGERIINLSKTADPSTFLHETAHLFLEMEKQLAAKYGPSENQQRLLDWFGVDSFDEVTTEHHEKYAETFEKYLEGGRAPSLALRDAFARFRAWLIGVYRNLTTDPRTRADLSPEITEYFDRMLATDEEIARVAANPAYDELFRSAEQAGMTDEQWEKYQKQRQRVKDRATTTVDQKVIDELRKRKTREWNDEKAPLIDEEMERLAAEPIYQVLTDLNVAPINYNDVVAITGGKLPGKLIGKATKDGVDAQEYAEVHGFDSAKELIRVIEETPTLKQAADAAAEERMVAKYGDILNDGSIEREARDAMENEEQAKLLLMELRALDRTTPDIDRERLKLEAKRLVSTMRYKQLRPNRYYLAAQKAAVNAAQATDKAERIRFKTQQLANHYLYREAMEVRARMERQRKYIRAVPGREYNTKQVNYEYVQQMKVLAASYDMSATADRTQKALSVLSWMEAQIPTVDIAIVDTIILDAMARKNAGTLPSDWQLPHFDDLTAEQLEGVYQQLRILRTIGGQLADETVAEMQAKRRELQLSITENARGTSETPGQPRFLESQRRQFSHMLNSLPSIRNLIRRLDGEYDDGNEGAGYRLIYRLLQEGDNRELDLHTRMWKLWTEQLERLHEVAVKRTDHKEYVLENGNTFRLHSESRFMMGVYWGTETSREAIRQGFGLTDNDVMAMLNDLTDAQLDLINETWRLNETLWDDLSQASVRRYGVSPPKLDPTPFTVRGKAMTGGHQRLYYDSPIIDKLSEEQQMGEFNHVAPTKAGSLHARVGSGGRAPNLDVHNITQAMGDTVHFVAWSDIGVELQSLLNEETRETIRRSHGSGYLEALTDNIKAQTANRTGRETSPGVASMLRVLRSAATARHLMYSIRNVMQQPSALPAVIQEVGSPAFTGAVMRLVNEGKALTDIIDKKSTFMAERTVSVNREAAIALRQISVSNELQRRWDKFVQNGFWMQTKFDALLAYPTWLAKYELAIEEGHAEADAVSIADTAVAESVGSGRDLHLGLAFRQSSNELLKNFTLFGSWFNNYSQRVYKATHGFTAFNMEAASAVFTVPVASAIMAAALIMDGPDDDESYWEWAAKEYTKFVAGTVPLLREIVSYAVDDFEPRTVWATAITGVGRGVSSMGDVLEGEGDLKDLKNIMGAGATVVPIPGIGNIIRVTDYMDSYYRGNEGGKPAPLEAYQAVVEGRDKNG